MRTNNSYSHPYMILHSVSDPTHNPLDRPDIHGSADPVGANSFARGQYTRYPETVSRMNSRPQIPVCTDLIHHLLFTHKSPTHQWQAGLFSLASFSEVEAGSQQRGTASGLIGKVGGKGFVVIGLVRQVLNVELQVNILG